MQKDWRFEGRVKASEKDKLALNKWEVKISKNFIKINVKSCTIFCRLTQQIVNTYILAFDLIWFDLIWFISSIKGYEHSDTEKCKTSKDEVDKGNTV